MCIGGRCNKAGASTAGAPVFSFFVFVFFCHSRESSPRVIPAKAGIHFCFFIFQKNSCLFVSIRGSLFLFFFVFCFENLNFEHSKLLRISDFVLRICLYLESLLHHLRQPMPPLHQQRFGFQCESYFDPLALQQADFAEALRVWLNANLEKLLR